LNNERDRWIVSSCLALWLVTLACPVRAALVSGLEAPLHALKGGRQPFRLSFREESGELTQKVVTFRFYVTGKALFRGPPRKGNLTFGDGKVFIEADSEGGLFEMDVETPVAEELTFLLEEESEQGVLPLVQTLLGDDVEGARSRLYGVTLGGAPHTWAIGEQAVEAGAMRTGPRAWWSGAMQLSRDSALVSIPVHVPSHGKSFLRFAHRFGLEPEECLAAGAGHHGAVVEVETAPEVWQALTPAAGYPGTVVTSCDSALKGKPAFVGSTGGAFREDTFDLQPLAGKRGRLRWRLATGCEECGTGEGWFLDDVVWRRRTSA